MIALFQMVRRAVAAVVRIALTVQAWAGWRAIAFGLLPVWGLIRLWRAAIGPAWGRGRASGTRAFMRSVGRKPWEEDLTLRRYLSGFRSEYRSSLKRIRDRYRQTA